MDIRLKARAGLRYLHLKWLLFLRAVLHLWVRSKVFPEDVAQTDINPDVPTCYVMDTYALSSLLILDKSCELNSMQRPLYPIADRDDLEPRAWAALRKLSGIGMRRVNTRSCPEILKALIKLSREDPSFEVQIVSVAILVGRAPDKEDSLTRLLFAEGWEVDGRLTRLLSTFISGRDTCVYFGPTMSLRSLVSESADDDIAARKVFRLARMQLRRIRETAIGPDLSHRRTLMKQVADSPRVRAAVAEAAESGDLDNRKLNLKVERTVEEIAANYSYSVIRFSDVMLTWVWNKLYNGVDFNHFKSFTENSTGKEIIYVPCHRSHVDYLLLSYLLYNNGYVPPHIAAGANLNLPGLGPLLRRGGAFFLRRNFRDDPIYSAVFDEYLSVILSRGVAIEYFIEGGRSRTGRLLPPKAGMLQMTVRAYLRQQKKPIIFQPVYIGYEQLVEGGSYITELGGKPKKSESLSDLLGIIGILRHNYGKVHVNFGEPLYLDSLLDSHAGAWQDAELEDKPEWLPALVDELATGIMTHINAAADVNPINLLAVCLLAAPKHALPEDELSQQIDLCLTILRSSQTPDKVTITDLEPAEIIQYGRELGVIKTLQHSLGDIIVIAEKSSVLLTYFRNNVSHLFALPSFLAACFLVLNEIPKSRVLRLFDPIYPFIRKELFLPWNNKEAKEALQHYIELFTSLELISGSRTLRRASGGSQSTASLGLLGRGLLQTFERYFITITVLSHRGSGTLNAGELEELCILYAQRISMLHEFDAPEFYDKTLFRTFIENLHQEGLVSEGETQRLEFGPELENLSAGARLVMSTELRHGILQVASGTTPD
jgi:glycerol-3-phosphate O-acyltransferase